MQELIRLQLNAAMDSCLQALEAVKAGARCHLECLLEELRPWGSVEEDLEQATVAMLGRKVGPADNRGHLAASLVAKAPREPETLSSKPASGAGKQQQPGGMLYTAGQIPVRTPTAGKQLPEFPQLTKPSSSDDPCWGEVQVQEESEGGHQVQSTLRVPLQVTVPLQELLFALCQQVNRLFGHCMPKGIQSEVGQLLTSCLEPAYIRSCQAIVTQQLPPALCQTWALQLLMDLHVLNLLFQGGMLSTARATVEAQVDPFDLDVLMPHLGRQASLAAQQTSHPFMRCTLPRQAKATATYSCQRSIH
ncbi:hypothetical protein HPB52_006079 [Rhipicephalus sanguineus]|uniref:Conserved oligomeric Golgi complex subunit 1 n=1 Tax=Rhipicephalus sanguineus TaxID=34632 RepID=A0A9D4PYS5_RHISA|nr:hypothetical protein HPB52_006079 [Rhipicephalus sanguineus]